MINTPLESIIRPTDFSPAGLDAIAHVLRLAIAAKALFYIVHIERGTELDDWEHFPRVRETLAAWGMVAPDAPQSAMARELGVMAKKVIVNLDEPVRGVGTFVEQHPCDLLVLMTHARSAPQRWLQGSVAEAAARLARVQRYSCASIKEVSLIAGRALFPCRQFYCLSTVSCPVGKPRGGWC